MLSARQSSRLWPILKVQASSVQATAKFHKEKVEPERLDTLGKWIQYWRFNIPYLFNIQHHLNEDKWAKLFCIEGNIGVGKTAFAKEFAEILELKNYDQETDFSYLWLRSKRVPQERIDYELSGKSVSAIARNTSLKQFLENPEDVVHTTRYQLEKYKSKHMQFIDAERWLLTTGQGAVLKRHFFTDPAIMYALKKMSWTTKPYREYYGKVHKFCSTYLFPPQVVIYLHVSPEQCYENTQKNGTALDKKLPLDFYKYIEEGYNELYMPKADEVGVNVIKIDWSEKGDIKEIIDDLDELPTLDHPYTQWKATKEVFNGLKKHLKFTEARMHDTSRIFHYFDELDEPWWTIRAVDQENKVVPWRYSYGFNKALGDKDVNFRASYPRRPFSRD